MTVDNKNFAFEINILDFRVPVVACFIFFLAFNHLRFQLRKHHSVCQINCDCNRRVLWSEYCVVGFFFFISPERKNHQSYLLLFFELFKNLNIFSLSCYALYNNAETGTRTFFRVSHPFIKRQSAFNCFGPCPLPVGQPVESIQNKGLRWKEDMGPICVNDEKDRRLVKCVKSVKWETLWKWKGDNIVIDRQTLRKVSWQSVESMRRNWKRYEICDPFPVSLWQQVGVRYNTLYVSRSTAWLDLKAMRKRKLWLAV